jgi:hypothetical protein
VNTSIINFSNMSDHTHPKLFFGTLGLNSSLSITECSTSTTYVDAQATCMARGALGKANCGIGAIRKKLENTESPSMSLLESRRITKPQNPDSVFDPAIPKLFLEQFMDILDDTQIGSGVASVIERYLEDPSIAFSNSPAFSNYADLVSIDMRVFEKRFALVYNTLWKAGWAYTAITGGNITERTDAGTKEQLLNTASKITSPLPAVYAINTPWMILYFVSVTIMFFAAVSSLILHQRCQAPPILGFVSTLVRDSKFFDDSQTQGNSAENATEKSKRLGKTKVMIADVKSGDEVGRIAFVPIDSGGRVRKRRWYM